MRHGIFLLLSLFLLTLNSCSKKINYYKIPEVDQVLTIYSPMFSDYAYVRIGKSNSIETDSFDLKILKGETTEVALIFYKHKCDTIYYADRWNDVQLINQNKIYRQIVWHNDTFYFKETATNRYIVNPKYVEVVIKDEANFVVCQLNNLYHILRAI